MASDHDDDAGHPDGAAARDADRRLAALIDHMPDAMVYRLVQKPGGGRHFTYVSAGVVGLHGVTPEAVYADSEVLFAQIHPADREHITALDRASESGVRFEHEVRMCVPGRPERWSILRSSRWVDPSGASVWDGVEFDITERKRAEEAIRAGEERYRALTTIGSEGILLHDGGIIVAMNKRFAELIEVEDPATTIGKDGRDLIPFTDASRDLIRQRAASDVYHEPVEIELVRRDGSICPAETSSVPILFDGRAMRLVTMRDISTRKRMEEDRARVDERLRLAQKMESIGRLAGGIAHDFNNLLTVIGGNVTVVKQTVSHDGALAALADIEEAVAMAVGLTRQLLAFSRKEVVQPTVLDVNEVVTRLRTVLGRVLGEDVVLETRLAPALPKVKIDPGHLDQIVLNLAVNARDAMPRGGALTLTTRALGAPKPGVELVVTDNGSGMSDDTRARVFEPFFTTKPAGKGTGLGLAIVYAAVTEAGGDIDIHSELGRGTEMRIRFPALSDGSAATPAPPTAAAVPRGREHILLVEDDPLVRALGKRVLSGLGYEVTAAASGDEALRVIAGGAHAKVDVLFTDVVMPGMGGRDLAERFLARSPETKVLFTSGHTDDLVVHHGVREKSIAFLAKPYAPDVLAQRIRHLIDGT